MLAIWPVACCTAPAEPAKVYETAFLLSCTRQGISKNQKKFSQALHIVNEILTKDQNYSDVLFLKAKILREGFGNKEGAKGYLKRVISQSDVKGTSVHRWARAYYEELDTPV